MKKTLLPFLIALIWVLSLSVRASHILGGEIKMETTGQANQYSITMIQFWDKTKLTIANQDPWVELLFYRKRDNALIYKHRIPLLSTEIVAYQNDVCTQLRSLDSRVGTYNGLVTLNTGDFNDPEGYYIVWERCCRNAAISNIRSPGESGLVFYLEFPPLSIRNSSPVFKGPNGDYICKDVPYTTNAAATDADGDELRYSLVIPFRGNTTEQNPDGTDQPKAGYPLVEWSAGNSAQNAIPGNPALSIDARTGQLTVTANQLGLFVFTVLCEEYRNGRRIGAVRRDYQSLVIECNPPPPAPVIISETHPLKTVEICEGESKNLEINESGDWTYQWYRSEQAIPGATNPTLEVREAGIYKVIKSLRDQQCTGTATSQPVEVKFRKPPSAAIAQSKNALCEGESLALTTAKNDDYIYEWRHDSNLLSETSSVLLVKEAGNYFLMVRDKATGCTATARAELKMETISVDLPAQISVLRGESVTLLPDVKSSLPVSYVWSPPTGLSDPAIAQPVAKPNQTISYIVKIVTDNGCTASDSIRVVVIDCSLPPPPIIVQNGTAVQRVEFCSERPASLQIDEPGDWAYQWQLDGNDIIGVNAEDLKVTQLGSYSVIRKFKKSELCAMSSGSGAVKLVAGTPPAITVMGADKALCQGRKVEISTSQDASYSYRWLFGNGKVVGTEARISVDEAGKYQLMVTNEKNGCTARDSAIVKLDISRIPTPLVLQNGLLAQTVEFCSGSSVKLEVQSPGDWVYQWYLNGNEIQGAKTANLAVGEMGNYTVARNFKAEGHCAGPALSKPVELIAGKTPSVTIAKSTEILCNGEVLELKAEENVSYTYEWSFNAKKTIETGSSIIVRQGGLYGLLVRNKQSGCSASDSTMVLEEKIGVTLPNQLIVRRGESTVLGPMVTSSTQPVTYLWSPSAGLDDLNALKPITSPDQTINYVLLATTPGGCTATDTVEVIIVDRVYIPDAFSPNGDGVNDLLMLPNGKELIENIRIYDRWGNLVYFSNDYGTPWDGKFKGSKVPSGVYTYTVKTSFENYKGSIMVLY